MTGKTELLKTDSSFYKIVSSFNNCHIGIAGRAANHISYRNKTGSIRQEEKRLISDHTGIEMTKILFLNQMHEDTILLVDGDRRDYGPVAGDADGFITSKEGICLVIRTADCVPLFAYDPEKNILGAAHSGWRGTSLEIAKKLVQKMASQFDSDYRNIQVFILPSIGPNSYIVNSDVGDLFPDSVTEKDGKLHLSLWDSIEKSLIREGIPVENIFNPEICNYIFNKDFFSYRRGDRERNLNFGYLNS